MVTASALRTPAELIPQLATVPGYFTEHDARLFVAVHDEHRRIGDRGDLLEIGVAEGRSALLLGGLVGGGERLVLCDLWGHQAGAPPADPAEVRGARRFLERYRSVHSHDPELVVASSDRLRDLQLPTTFRLVHVDGSHDHDVVAADADLVAEILAPGGVVAFDDISSRAWPGVAAAVWPRVAAGVFVPFLLTADKLYATTHPSVARRLQKAVGPIVADLPAAQSSLIDLAGHSVIHVRPVHHHRSPARRLRRAVTRVVRPAHG